MPKVNPEILTWARETAGFSIEEAAKKLGLKDTKNQSAEDKLTAYEQGLLIPSRKTILAMSKRYYRPLVTFYMSHPPRKGNRGQDFRTLPDEYSYENDVLLDALIRDIKARQSIVKDLLEEDEDYKKLDFVNSMNIKNGVSNVSKSIQKELSINIDEFRSQNNIGEAFSLLREKAEAVGIYVLLISNLGSHHTNIPLETFRGFALADQTAPFIVINDQDAKSAWSFTLLHEIAHIWIGESGVSGTFSDIQIERFCNDVSSNILLPDNEVKIIAINDNTSFKEAITMIDNFSEERKLSRSMVAYKLYRKGLIAKQTWEKAKEVFRTEWLSLRERQRDTLRAKEGGPDYYIVKRSKVGNALIDFVSRMLIEGNITPTKAGILLGVKSKNVVSLINQ